MIAGRKRKPGPRYPSGDRVVEKDADIHQIAQSMPHRQDVPEGIRHDYRAESAFGRLLLTQQISGKQYQAGIIYRGIVSRYKAILDSPPMDPASMAGVLIGPWGRSSRNMDDNEIARRRDDYNAAYETLETGAGNRGARAVAHWIFEKGDLPIEHLRCGLNILIVHFGLTR